MQAIVVGMDVKQVPVSDAIPSGYEIVIHGGRKYMGMENWLPFFYEEPLPSLFDYLPAAHVVLDRSVDDALLAKEDGIYARLASIQSARATAGQEVE